METTLRQTIELAWAEQEEREREAAIKAKLGNFVPSLSGVTKLLTVIRDLVRLFLDR